MAQQGRMPSADFSYVKRMPGLAVAVQLLTCFFAFILSVAATWTYYVDPDHGFFIFVMSLATTSCILWLVVRVLRLDACLPANFNWNIAGLVHNGVLGFLVMAAGFIMVGIDILIFKAAGVFAFLSSIGFVIAFVYELFIRCRGRRSPADMASATVV